MQKDSFRKDSNISAEVKKILDLVKKSAPGNAVELRIPPYGVIQCVAGVNHRRGTPANQVEMSGEVLIQLAQSPDLWPDLLQLGQIQASGQLSDLSQVFSQTFK